MATASGSPTPAVLRCTALSKRFGTRVAADGISFSVGAGEVYGLLGPNGAGKTTTIRMVCGLLDPDTGTVVVEGKRVGSDRSVKARIGYVPQEIALYPDLTARENLAFLGRLYRLHGALLAERVAAALEVTDLTERSDERVDSYSGGMKRRLNIAAGLVNHPSLLVLDEPTVGVDPQSRHSILERVKAFAADGMSVLYTTHYMEEAERVCDRVGIIDRGRLIAEGTRRELVSRLGERDRIDLVVSGDAERLAIACQAVPGVDEAAAADGRVHLLAADGRRALPAILETAESTGVPVGSVEITEADLEAVFLHLTGTALRE